MPRFHGEVRAWDMRTACDGCGKDRMVSEMHFERRDMPTGDIIKRAPRDGCFLPQTGTALLAG